MKHLVTLCVVGTGLVCIAPCKAPALTILAPGTYTAGWNIPYAPAAGEPIISIESSNVLLDLEGYTLDQTNTETGVSAISIGSGYSNIRIINGRIRNVTECGLIITPTGANNEQIRIENIVFENCGSEGIAVIPSGGFTTQNLNIKGCTFLDCARGASGSAIIRVIGNALLLDSIAITQRLTTTALAGSRTAIQIDGAKNGIFHDIRISGIRATGDLLGINAPSSTSVEASLFQDIIVSDFYTTLGNNTGINAAGCKNSAFTGCLITSSTGIITTGIALSNQQNPNIFVACTTEDLFGTSTARGFIVDTADNALFIDCVANRITTTGTNGNADGFVLSGATRCHALRCVASNGLAVGTGTQTTGFRLTNASACSLSECFAMDNNGTSVGTGYVLSPLCTECSIMDCRAYSNGNTATTGSGFRVDASGTGTNVFLRNAALRNSATAGNQFLNFLATQRTTIARTSTNTTVQPWTNIAVT